MSGKIAVVFIGATNCVDGIIYLGQKLARQADPFAGPVGLIPSPDALYVEFDRGALAKVDLTSFGVSSAVRVDEQDYISDAVYAARSIWFSTFGNNTVLRLRPL